MKKVIFVSLALFIFLFAAAEKSAACSCIVSAEPAKKQIQEAFNNSDAIFSGEVIEVKESPADKNNLLIKMKIAQSWKGESSGEITIKTAKESSVCGYDFEVGKKYLVYASGLKENLTVYNCSRTTTADNKKSDVKYLKKLKQGKKIAA